MRLVSKIYSPYLDILLLKYNNIHFRGGLYYSIEALLFLLCFILFYFSYYSCIQANSFLNPNIITTGMGGGGGGKYLEAKRMCCCSSTLEKILYE